MFPVKVPFPSQRYTFGCRFMYKGRRKEKGSACACLEAHREPVGERLSQWLFTLRKEILVLQLLSIDFFLASGVILKELMGWKRGPFLISVSTGLLPEADQHPCNPNTLCQEEGASASAYT